MKIALYSDLHLEMHPFDPPETDADVVVLAGDIGVKLQGVQWALQNFKDRRVVIYVPGNHEFYGWALDRGMEKLKAEVEGTNVHILDRDAVLIDGVRFLGCIAWTDFDLFGNQPMAALQAQGTMSDYRKIRMADGGKYRPLRPGDTLRQAQEFKIWLKREMEVPHQGKTVVVTHHSPCIKSLAEHDAVTAPFYASRWEHLMQGVDLWMHGHTHRASDYQVGDCRAAVNPRGYPGQETGFDPDLLLEV